MSNVHFISLACSSSSQWFARHGKQEEKTAREAAEARVAQLEEQLAQAGEAAKAEAARAAEQDAEQRKALETRLEEAAVASAAAAAAAEATRMELQGELNMGRQRIAGAEKARLELEVGAIVQKAACCASLPHSKACVFRAVACCSCSGSDSSEWQIGSCEGPARCGAGQGNSAGEGTDEPAEQRGEAAQRGARGGAAGQREAEEAGGGPRVRPPTACRRCHRSRCWGRQPSQHPHSGRRRDSR